MRLFIYKTIFIFFCLIIAYKFTIDNTINKLETKFERPLKNILEAYDNQIYNCFDKMKN